MVLRELGLIDLLDVFIPGRIEGEAQITKKEPLEGELVCDSGGFWFISPEEDYRGGGMGSIPVHNLPGEVKRNCRGQIVKVSGVFKDGHGLTIESIAPKRPASDYDYE